MAVVVCWSVFHIFVPVDMLVFDEISSRMLVYMLAGYQKLMFLSILNDLVLIKSNFFTHILMLDLVVYSDFVTFHL